MPNDARIKYIDPKQLVTKPIEGCDEIHDTQHDITLALQTFDSPRSAVQGLVSMNNGVVLVIESTGSSLADMNGRMLSIRDALSKDSTIQIECTQNGSRDRWVVMGDIQKLVCSSHTVCDKKYVSILIEQLASAKHYQVQKDIARKQAELVKAQMRKNRR